MQINERTIFFFDKFMIVFILKKGMFYTDSIVIISHINIGKN